MSVHQLETAHCTLLPFQAKEVEAFWALNTDPFVRRYLWDDAVISQETAQELLTQNQQLFAEEGYGLWRVSRKGGPSVIGYVGLWFFFAEPQPQLIYAFREEATGQGLATECARAVVDHAFTALNFDYLLAATDAPHSASQRLALRLGMHLVEKRKVDGKETWFYRLDRSDWSQAPG